MTVDVEDYFQVSAFEKNVARDAWETTPLRVEKNVDRILQVFDDHDVKATFFTLGWIAERCPAMVSRIVSEGHELASHGWEHVRVTNQTPTEFSADVTKTKMFLEDLGGCSVNGYRAASYSIGASNLWALDVLADCGYRYSSSIAPIKHDLYGMPDAPRFRFTAAQGRLVEVPITTIPVAGKNINCGGGGWFRLFPYSFSKWALGKVNSKELESGLFYFHPWEIDPEQPRIEGAGAKTRFRHYLNLSRMQGRLEMLLSDFSWGRMDDVFFNDEERRAWQEVASVA
ncbi:polysaccharide deacetylase family protein, PEP-CTERM locus subfamily [Congregibacter litoralis KT71]|uniref:Polysaccharide deacetylase family protein, PEP-CTERM locus subfamily n=2 Tax=Congregibacter TaxID=393661 RepID=A4A537_9GAMM|nr:polysaccharide deacetylase family protein, PEP-CTERM locus subfamily [Congregibacter litoralis KT71]